MLVSQEETRDGKVPDRRCSVKGLKRFYAVLGREDKRQATLTEKTGRRMQGRV